MRLQNILKIALSFSLQMFLEGKDSFGCVSDGLFTKKYLIVLNVVLVLVLAFLDDGPLTLIENRSIFYSWSHDPTLQR